MNLSSLLKERCHSALGRAFPAEIADIEGHLLEITEATQEKFGHYQFNGALKLTKILGAHPRQIAEKIVWELEQMPEAKEILHKIEIAGPGFINFTLKESLISDVVQQLLSDPKLGVTLPASQRVVIDFSSPNIAKEMHIGHLRSTIIGDCLARILKFMGHDVLEINHVGDWGTQFGMLIAHIKSVFPEITNIPSSELKLSQLVSWYQAAKKRFDEDPIFKKDAQLEVVALQSGQEAQRNVWEKICAVSRLAYQEIYDLLDIQLIERGESFYNPLLAPLIQELKEKKVLSLSDGAQCVLMPGFTNREGDPLPLILQKKDGGFNYATTDMAALRHRVSEEHADWLIYVTDAGQGLHFQMVFEAAKKAGFYDARHTRLDHVPFGLVLKADGKKFQTRSGETEKLIDVLQTAILLSKEKLLAHNPEIDANELQKSATVLGINAIKYADLSCNRLSDYMFSYEKMLQFEGNTAAFLLYALVRIRSIQRKVSKEDSNASARLINKNAHITLKEPAEIALGLLLCQFGDTLDRTLQELLPNRLTDYLYRVAERFHGFFHQCRVEGSSDQDSRLLLCEASARVLSQGLQLLGLKTLERM